MTRGHSLPRKLAQAIFFFAFSFFFFLFILPVSLRSYTAVPFKSVLPLFSSYALNFAAPLLRPWNTCKSIFAESHTILSLIV
jgi:hypothetical protein